MKVNGTTPHTTNHPSKLRQSLSANVLMSLTSDERATLEEVSGLEQRSLSATARMLFLDGLRAYQKATDEG